MPSVNLPGRILTFKITSNATFLDHASGSSQIAGNTFGVSLASGAYSNDVPFFLYAVINSAQTSPSAETTLTFMISRMPNVMTTLGSAKISPLGGTAASTQGGFFALGAITASNYANSSALSLGCFRMQATSSIGDWTVSSLSSVDGIGRFFENYQFAVPTGAFGAASGSVFYSNSGTAPVFSTPTFVYWVDKNGTFTGQTALNNCSTAGVGSNFLQLACPYNMNGTVAGQWFLTFSSGSAVTISGTASLFVGQPSNAMLAIYTNGSTAQNLLLNSSIVLTSTFSLDYGFTQSIIFS
jgi:hypothetical protein